MYEAIPEIIIEILKLCGAVIGAWFVYKAAVDKPSKKHSSDKKDHPLVRTNMAISLRSFSMISDLVQDIFNKTTADRFLILAAHNGKSPLRYATAFYEQHNQASGPDTILSIGAVSRYVKFEFDKYYVRMLEQVEDEGFLELDVSEMPICDLRNIYTVEGVKRAKIYFLLRAVNHDGDGNDLLIYCSVASHKETPYTEEEKVIFKYNVSQIKTLISQTFSID